MVFYYVTSNRRGSLGDTYQLDVCNKTLQVNFSVVLIDLTHERKVF